MGILNSVATKGLKSLGINTDSKVTAPPPPDFRSFNVYEIVKGKLKDLNENDLGLGLSGSFMPKIPFTFGTSQEIKKDYYAGAEHPSVQVLGVRNDDVVIKGRLYLKRLNRPNTPNEFKIEGGKKVAVAYQERMDAVCRRGNMVKIEMGEWVRYGFLEKAKFTMNRLVDIEFELSFIIIGHTMPDGCKATNPKHDNAKQSNSDLIKAAGAAVANVKNYPDSMPRSLADFLNDQVGAVANVVADVTGFVDGVVDDADNLLNSANRALGMIKYARSYLSKTLRRLSLISYSASNLGSAFSSEADKLSAQIRNASFINSTKVEMFSLAAFLAALQKKFEGIAQTTPQSRHLVTENDTLQKISIKYFGDSASWKKIYDHNKLTTTTLVKGSVLEIPR
jgi:nucleoid-associated protein YgaU